MRKILLLTISFVFFYSIKSFSQKWYSASYILEYPKSNGSGESLMAYVNKYDTVICIYKFRGSEMISKGYKMVYKKNGFIIDDLTTINVFFDEKKQRIQNVSQYAFVN